jgi:hypothetical protein
MTIGSVVVYQLSQKQIVVGADSRASNGHGAHRDDECKIRTFGGKFVFASTGVNGPSKRMVHPWSTYAEGENAWRDASRFSSMSSAKSLAHQTAEKWAVVMEEHLNDAYEISAMRAELRNGNGIESGIFAATNERGELGVSTVLINIDLKAFDTDHVVRLTHTVNDFAPPAGGAIGLGGVADEYAHETSQRAKDFMVPYLKKLESLSPDKRDIEIVKKLIELCIDLDTMKDFLGRPVDEVILERGKGIEWIHLKSNCPR